MSTRSFGLLAALSITALAMAVPLSSPDPAAQPPPVTLTLSGPVTEVSNGPDETVYAGLNKGKWYTLRCWNRSDYYVKVRVVHDNGYKTITWDSRADLVRNKQGKLIWENADGHGRYRKPKLIIFKPLTDSVHVKVSYIRNENYDPSSGANKWLKAQGRHKGHTTHEASMAWETPRINVNLIFHSEKGPAK